MNTQINLNQPRIQPSSSTGCKASSLTSQFACPTGLLGGGVGRLMAVKNAKMNEFAVEMLDIQPDDQALEIGFGHLRSRTAGISTFQAPVVIPNSPPLWK
jgi:predicted acyl esterase